MALRFLWSFLEGQSYHLGGILSVVRGQKYLEFAWRVARCTGHPWVCCPIFSGGWARICSPSKLVLGQSD